VSPGELLEAVCARLGDAVLERHDQLGDATLTVRRERIRDVLTALRDDPELGFNLLMDLTGVDYPGRDPRFEVVYHLAGIELEPPGGGASVVQRRLRIKVGVPEVPCSLLSVSGVYASANWMEREAWDMYGIRFDGHPDPRRILLYEEFQGHPLRKDYPKHKRQPLVGALN
jgi:NADH-quinone oxidoreductase subunit C